MLRRWFCPPYSVCTECGVHFEPVGEQEQPWGHLCHIHRAPVRERARRIENVVEWARQNWESLEPQVLKEREERAKLYDFSIQAAQRAAQDMKQAARQQASATSLFTQPFNSGGM